MHDARYLSQAEIDSLDPEPLPRPGSDPLARAREAITASGHWNAGQQFGQRWPIGCVALEITQRCNLDCTLCYLSENSEAVRDIPIEEIHRRIDLIHQHYGPGTDVQVTGGEPTLRARADLVEIIQAIAARGMRSTLMTNGVHASRELLEALSAAGLSDVAFHVDTTQEIKGFDCEAALNQRRLQYIERARGLPLGVFFNTTVHRDNFHEVAGLAAFFAEHAAAVRTASFQLQADTGRGVAGRRDVVITPDTVTREIERGIGSALRFDASLVGHPACTRYAKCLVLGGEALDLFDEPAFIRRVQSATAHLRFDRRAPRHGGLEPGWLVVYPSTTVGRGAALACAQGLAGSRCADALAGTARHRLVRGAQFHGCGPTRAGSHRSLRVQNHDSRRADLHVPAQRQARPVHSSVDRGGGPQSSQERRESQESACRQSILAAVDRGGHRRARGSPRGRSAAAPAEEAERSQSTGGDGRTSCWVQACAGVYAQSRRAVNPG